VLWNETPFPHTEFMDNEPSQEVSPKTIYLSGRDADAVRGWMWALEYPEDDREVVAAYCAKRAENKDFDLIAEEIGWPVDALHIYLEAVESSIEGAIKANWDMERAASAKVNAQEIPQPQISPVIERARNGRAYHPTLQAIGGQACGGLKPRQIDKFFSSKTKDQESAAQRFCTHCGLKGQCREMAIEETFSNAVYGGLARHALQAEIRLNERVKDKNKKKKKKK
jgi:hypothetical protein